MYPVSQGSPAAQRKLALASTGKLATAFSARGVSRLSLEMRIGKQVVELGEIDMVRVKRSKKQVGEPLDPPKAFSECESPVLWLQRPVN